MTSPNAKRPASSVPPEGLRLRRLYNPFTGEEIKWWLKPPKAVKVYTPQTKTGAFGPKSEGGDEGATRYNSIEADFVRPE